MLMTKEQAAATWCPMVRMARHETIHPNSTAEENHIVGGCNTDALGRTRVPASCRCIADKCAMWRWDASLTDNEKEALEAGTVSGVDLVKGWTPKGYCGLAGRPA